MVSKSVYDIDKAIFVATHLCSLPIKDHPEYAVHGSKGTAYKAIANDILSDPNCQFACNQ